MSEATLRDPVAARAYTAKRGQTIGLFAVWPSETRDLILRIDPSMVATDAAVRSCTALAPAEVQAWNGFFQSWRAFAAEGVPTFGSARKWDEAEAYRVQLSGWQDELSTKCTIPGPKLSPPDTAGDVSSAVKWVAAAVVAASLVYGIRTVLK